jgi:hypothetical protein
MAPQAIAMKVNRIPVTVDVWQKSRSKEGFQEGEGRPNSRAISGERCHKREETGRGIAPGKMSGCYSRMVPSLARHGVVVKVTECPVCSFALVSDGSPQTALSPWDERRERGPETLLVT